MEHASSAWPNEAVGVIGHQGDGLGIITAALANCAGPLQFWVDPYSQFLLERDWARRGLTIAAIYHSHPGGTATLSPEDVEFARRWPCAHLVVAVTGRSDSPEARAYHVVEDGTILPLELQIASESEVP